MPEKWCESAQQICDPRHCNHEGCVWRDTIWVIKQMPKWAYSTDYKKPTPPVDGDPGSEPEKKTGS